MSHAKSKNELTGYLVEKFVDREDKTTRCCGLGMHMSCNKSDYLQSDQEELDTKMLFHALDTTANCATELFIHSPDTDNLVLSLRRFLQSCV